MVDNDTCRMFSLSYYGENCGEYSTSSTVDPLLSRSLVASHLYRFLVSFPLTHLCLESHFSPLCLHLSSFILYMSKLVFPPSCSCGGTHFVLSAFAVWGNIRLEYNVSTFGHYILSSFFSIAFAFCLASSIEVMS